MRGALRHYVYAFLFVKEQLYFFGSLTLKIFARIGVKNFGGCIITIFIICCLSGFPIGVRALAVTRGGYYHIMRCGGDR